MSRRKPPSRPLGLREGVDPTRTRLTGWWPTVIDELAARFPHAVEHLLTEVRAGRVWQRLRGVDSVVTTTTPAVAGADIWSYRPLPAAEPPVTTDLPILWRDERILVVDKPHFLPTIPRGSYVTHTALVQLRRATGIDTLAPAHRLDALTAGVLVFTVDPTVRGAYQELFAQRRVVKQYEAITSSTPSSPCNIPATTGLRDEPPFEIRSRLVKERGTPQVREIPVDAEHPANAITRVETVEETADGAFLRWRLAPTTGRTHQLRVHLSSLGYPIVGDPLYPVVNERTPGDHSHPLQLLARQLQFRDPIDGVQRKFSSTRELVIQ